jgi:hypothetical protein
MKGNEKEAHGLSLGFCRKERIETQIHRRRHVKAFSALALEWETPQAGPPLFGEANKAKGIQPLRPE